MMEALRISVGVENDHYETTFEFDGRRISVISPEDADTLRNFRAPYVHRLYEARLKLGQASPNCTERQASAFLREVHDLGSELQQKLFGVRLPEVSGLFVEALRPSAANPPKTEARVIVLDVAGLFFPLEILPLLDLAPIQLSHQKAYVVLRARSFVGMMAVVQRTLRQDIDQNNVLACAPRLAMKLFYHADLAGAHEDIKFFRNHEAIALDGPWPPGATKQAGILGLRRMILDKIGIGSRLEREEDSICQRNRFLKAFTGFLTNPGKSFDGGTREPPDQICHFSCHCAKSADNGDYRLIMKGVDGDEESVTIGEIQRHISQSYCAAWQGSQPFVFLSACSTGVSQPGDFARFETLFAGTRHRGLITTGTNVPDLFASSLAQTFYNSLLANLTVGQALHHARWDMLAMPTNPLGLLYYLYGSPYLSLARPVFTKQFGALPA